MNRMLAITPPPPLNLRLWLSRRFIAFVIVFAALVTIADGSLPRAETHRIEEPCGVALIGACLPRKVAAWEQTQGTVVEATRGFTLLELAIVLMVIGLIVGGILWGAEMIGQAAAQAQITQIQKYDSAVNAFKNKYNGIPGDIDSVSAANFGFAARAGTAGRGDGNGELDGVNGQGVSWNINGEDMLFWEDLASAGMVDGSFQSYVDNTAPYCGTAPNPSCSTLFPPAKIGNGNMIFVYSGYAPVTCCAPTTGLGPNFFGLEIINSLGSQNVGSSYASSSAPGLTVSQAYAIDKKIDDGMPTTGRVRAQLLSPVNGIQSWSANGSLPSATTCYDTSTGVAAYSMSQNNGAYVNCGLSFQMQGAAR